MPTYPALLPFALATVALSLNLLFLWGISGGARAKTKSTPNEEDARTVARGATVLESTPESVARVLRAHANAQANILPTLLLSWVYVVLGGPATLLWIALGVFVAARWVHSFVYLAGKQPWRTLVFTVGATASLVVLGYDGYLAATLL